MADWYDELSAGEREYLYAYCSVLLCEAKEALDAGLRIPVLDYMAMCIEFHLIAWLEREFCRWAYGYQFAGIAEAKLLNSIKFVEISSSPSERIFRPQTAKLHPKCPYFSME